MRPLNPNSQFFLSLRSRRHSWPPGLLRSYWVVWPTQGPHCRCMSPQHLLLLLYPPGEHPCRGYSPGPGINAFIAADICESTVQKGLSLLTREVVPAHLLFTWHSKGRARASVSQRHEPGIYRSLLCSSPAQPSRFRQAPVCSNTISAEIRR